MKTKRLTQEGIVELEKELWRQGNVGEYDVDFAELIANIENGETIKNVVTEYLIKYGLNNKAMEA